MAAHNLSVDPTAVELVENSASGVHDVCVRKASIVAIVDIAMTLWRRIRVRVTGVAAAPRWLSAQDVGGKRVCRDVKQRRRLQGT